MTISIFELFSIGIGPSSSHTVGPMAAANAFLQTIQEKQFLIKTQRIQIDLYGSLALTGVGHGTDKAILNGLLGDTPENVDPLQIKPHFENIIETNTLNLANKHQISYDHKKDMLFHQKETLPKHTNGLHLSIYDENNNALYKETYYSVGGGFIVTDETFGHEKKTNAVPYPFDTATELLALCDNNQISIAKLMLENEKALHPDKDIKKSVLDIIAVMKHCISMGCSTKGKLPGGLQVKRRAAELFEKLKARGRPQPDEQSDMMNWLNLYAIAVNEENAVGGRIVTAPTNGAAGVVPAVLMYYAEYHKNATEQTLIDFILTAGAVAILYKKNASISGAEVGCQGEVGVASSMAAAALTAVLGGTLQQIENAAEIAMEHHLGMTCDPIDGLVQIPCIERNAMGAVKAVNATRLALIEDGEHFVPLDKVIKTMFATGRDMMTIYKETSLGGLAVNVPEC